MRLIDADKLKAHYAWWGECSEMAKKNKEVFDTIVDLQPSVEPKRVHARWGWSGAEGSYFCSKCRFIAFYNNFKFCPNCGAQMYERRTDNAEIH